MWGYNGDGQLGTNDIIARSSPIQTIAGGNNWKQVSAGSYQTAAVKTNGTLWMWGINTSGSLGNNTGTSVSSPIQTIAGGTNWKQVASSKGNSGYKVTAGIKTDGTLWVWGKNNYGQLAQNDRTDRSSPIQVTMGVTNAWQQVSTGYGHFMAITTIT
jgi:alpha-tubulin suppressor-like RCC1 family protein